MVLHQRQTRPGIMHHRAALVCAFAAGPPASVRIALYSVRSADPELIPFWGWDFASILLDQERFEFLGMCNDVYFLQAYFKVGCVLRGGGTCVLRGGGTGKM